MICTYVHVVSEKINVLLKLNYLSARALKICLTVFLTTSTYTCAFQCDFTKPCCGKFIINCNSQAVQMISSFFLYAKLSLKCCVVMS